METRYALVNLKPSGDTFAVRYVEDGLYTVTGVCGPLSPDETDAPGSHYDYDTDPDLLDQWNDPDFAYYPVKDL